MSDYYIFGPSACSTELRKVFGPFNHNYTKGSHVDYYKRMIEQGISDGVVTEPGDYVIIASSNGVPAASSLPITVEDTEPPPPPKRTLRVV